MKIKRKMSSYDLARRLQRLALQIASGKAVKIGNSSVLIPSAVVVEEEIEKTGNGTEIEIEICWPSSTGRSRVPRSSRRHSLALKKKE